MNEKVYVNSDGTIFMGEQAIKLLEDNNDLEYLTDRGIVQVPLSRWEKEQKYELQFAMIRQKDEKDDRNVEHYNYFDQFNSLPEVSHGNYIELGCGPFTNTRMILPLLKGVSSVTLLDPLINNYMTHPNCSYKESKLCGYPIHMVQSSIEEYSPDRKFDIVVIINVLEHCFDVPLILEKIYDMLSTDGLLIFSEVTISLDNLRSIASSIYDEGHAVRLSTDFIDDFLRRFQPVFRKDYMGLYNQPWRHDIYFIGRKR
jgi:SAM-dependent methyltransferase